ncbi:MAG: hypothetical protein WD766_05775 [Gemmatimonadota bacterium]
MTDLRTIAERRYQEALKRTGSRDARDYYRDRLKELRERSPDRYSEAAGYVEQTLLPAVAHEDSDPIGEWTEYGRLLASLLFEGETVQVDPSGRSSPYTRPVPTDHLVLHLPPTPRAPARGVGLPPRLSAAQRATYDLLVSRKTA